MKKDIIKAFEKLIDHSFTIIQMSDREKFHTGLLQYALKKYPKLYKLIFDIDGEFNSELEFKSIDLYIYESFNTKKPCVLVESKFKTGLHFSKTKNGEVKQIQKYADKYKSASKGYLISLFPESENLKINDQGTSFDLDDKLANILLRDFHLPMIGHHNALNACAAILAASNLSIPIKFIKNALANFEGVSRRFTRIGLFNGATIIDDYAHHPAEIEAVISAAKEIAKKRIKVVHQPHRFSRLKALFKDFTKCFEGADILGITPVFAAGEPKTDGFDSKSLIKSFTRSDRQKIEYIEDEISFGKFLKNNCDEGDIFLTLGAGSITNWVNNLSYVTDKSGNEYHE